MNKPNRIVALLIVSAVVVCGLLVWFMRAWSTNKDPVVCITLTERRGQYRLETSIEPSGKVFRGYYHETSSLYEKTAESKISSAIAKSLWKELEKGSIKRKILGRDPDGDFQSIGVTWQGSGGTYGVSYDYKELSADTPLSKVLKIIQDNELDNWDIPE